MNSAEIVHTIIAQIGGRDFATKTMLKTPVRYSDNEATAEVTAYFDISVPNERGINQIEVVYSFGTDTYRVFFWSNGKNARRLQKQYDDVYCDQISHVVNQEIAINIIPPTFGSSITSQ
jgi:formate-dependent nitrite reductase cytochrome c552 subunit